MLGEDIVAWLVGGRAFDTMHLRAALMEPARRLDGQSRLAPDDLLAIVPVTLVEAGAQQHDVPSDLDARLVLGRLHMLGRDIFEVADMLQVEADRLAHEEIQRHLVDALALRVDMEESIDMRA